MFEDFHSQWLCFGVLVTYAIRSCLSSRYFFTNTYSGSELVQVLEVSKSRCSTSFVNPFRKPILTYMTCQCACQICYFFYNFSKFLYILYTCCGYFWFLWYVVLLVHSRSNVSDSFGMLSALMINIIFSQKSH